PVTSPKETEAGTDSAGEVYLLVDRQENLERSAFYYHEVRKITSEHGVQDGASISVSFNPSFEKLIFHSIQLIRDGVASNRLDASRIQVLPRETDPERSIYDVSRSAQMVLEDVRIGDVIECAYTTEGANPLKRGNYSAVYSMQWSVPIV